MPEDWDDDFYGAAWLWLSCVKACLSKTYMDLDTGIVVVEAHTRDIISKLADVNWSMTLTLCVFGAELQSVRGFVQSPSGIRCRLGRGKWGI